MGLNRRHENTMDVRARDWVALRGAGGHVAVPVGALRGGWVGGSGAGETEATDDKV